MKALKYLTLLFVVGCSNAFTSFSDKQHEEALLYEAKEHIRAGNWTDAVNACSSIDSSTLKEERFAITCASAFAGRCGFDLQNLITVFTGIGPGSTIYNLLLNDINPTTAQHVADCDDAESILLNVGGASSRSAEANAFVVFLSFYKVGVLMNELADTDEDGNVDGGYDTCAMTDADTGMAATSFAEISDSLSVLAASSTYWDTLDTAMTGICTAVETVFDDTYNICKHTTGAFTANQLNGTRTMIREGALFGIDECGGDANAATCNCP